jgi:hypothetical protein
LLISDEMAVDGVAEAAFQRPPGLGRGLRLAEFALVKLPSDAAEVVSVFVEVEVAVPHLRPAVR